MGYPANSFFNDLQKIDMTLGQNPETILDTALSALATGEGFETVLDALPVPVYTTDAEGNVTYWNRSCVAVAGREPKLGRDRWCVTWQLYTMAGDRLPHEECPMAVTIKERRPVRDSIAIAERPDGTRSAFRPYPTPLFHADGSLKGAVNILIDVSEEQARALNAQADHCRRLADATFDAKTSRVLKDMASGLSKTAGQLSGGRNT
jgi:PAS domain S-box-containing protein